MKDRVQEIENEKVEEKYNLRDKINELEKN